MVSNFKKYFALSLIFIIGFAIIYLMRDYLTPIFGAIVFTFLLYPIYNYLNEKRGYSQITSASIILSGILLLILVPLFLFGGIIVSQINNLDLSEETLMKYEQRIYELTGTQISISDSILAFQNSIKEDIKSTLPRLISSSTNFLLSTFIMFFVMFYLLIEKDKFYEMFISILPFSKKNSNYLMSESKKVIVAVLIGQVLTAIIQGTLGMLSFIVAGIEGALFWGVVMIILSIIPVVGAFLVWLPAGIFLILNGDIIAGIGILLWGGLVVSQVDNIVRPKLVNKFADIHPLETFLGIFMGISAFGIIGILIGPLILSLFSTLIRVFRQEYTF